MAINEPVPRTYQYYDLSGTDAPSLSWNGTVHNVMFPTYYYSHLSDQVFLTTLPLVESPRMVKQTDVFLYDGDGKCLKTCESMEEAEREAKRLVRKSEDEIRIVRCVKVVRPKAIELEVEDV